MIFKVGDERVYRFFRPLPGEKRTEGGEYAYHSSALATALVRRSGCSPAEPYPPFQLGEYIMLGLDFACN